MECPYLQVSLILGGIPLPELAAPVATALLQLVCQQLTTAIANDVTVRIDSFCARAIDPCLRPLLPNVTMMIMKGGVDEGDE